MRIKRAHPRVIGKLEAVFQMAGIAKSHRSAQLVFALEKRIVLHNTGGTEIHSHSMDESQRIGLFAASHMRQAEPKEKERQQ